MRIKNAVAFVTGANRGLGLAFARELLARGARKVYAGVRNTDNIDIPGVVPVKLDVTDPASVNAAAVRCGDVTLVINNAGIAHLTPSATDASLVATTRTIFETNYYGVVHVSQAFAPVIAANGGGAFVNVLSVATWFAPRVLSAYAASKAAAWTYTNALRHEVGAQNIGVLALHVGFLDTDMTRGMDAPKSNPRTVAAQTLAALERGDSEILADEATVQVKQGMLAEHPYYLSDAAAA